MSFKRFHIWSSGNPLVWRSGTICAILEEGIIRNIPVKLFQIWTSGSRGAAVKSKSLQTDKRRQWMLEKNFRIQEYYYYIHILDFDGLTLIPPIFFFPDLIRIGDIAISLVSIHLSISLYNTKARLLDSLR